MKNRKKTLVCMRIEVTNRTRFGDCSGGITDASTPFRRPQMHAVHTMFNEG
jgi:hypothetical protein